MLTCFSKNMLKFVQKDFTYSSAYLNEPHSSAGDLISAHEEDKARDYP